MLSKETIIQTLTIRPAVEKDLAEIAKIHKIAYSKSHFTALLPVYVLMRYYGYFMSGGSEIHVVVEYTGESEKIQAFAVFGTGIPEMISRFKKECRFQIFKTSIRHPITSIKKLIGAIITKITINRFEEHSDFILLSIASRKKGQGIGKELLCLLKDRSRDRNFTSIGLFVNYDNESAINAYFKSGFLIKSRNRFQYYMEHSLI